jgi:hypothetical protein
VGVMICHSLKLIYDHRAPVIFVFYRVYVKTV